MEDKKVNDAGSKKAALHNAAELQKEVQKRI